MEEDEGKVQPLGNSRPYLGGLSFFAAHLNLLLTQLSAPLKIWLGDLASCLLKTAATESYLRVFESSSYQSLRSLKFIRLSIIIPSSEGRVGVGESSTIPVESQKKVQPNMQPSLICFYWWTDAVLIGLLKNVSRARFELVTSHSKSIKYSSGQQHFIFRQEAEAHKAKIIKSPLVQQH